MKRAKTGDGETAPEWGRGTNPRFTTILIVISFSGVFARLLWPEPLTGGGSGYLFGLIYLAAAVEAILELTSGFVWQSRVRYVRGGLLAVAALLYALLPT